MSHFKSPPHFIAKEAVNYLKLYLVNRKKRAPENLLFTTRDENHKIDTKNVSRTFRLTAQNPPKDKSVAHKFKIKEPSELRLYSLKDFYDKNTKLYREEAKNNPLADDEFFRDLYKKHAMLNLELETNITYQYTKKQYKKEKEYLDNENKQMNQTIAKDNEYISSILTLLYNNKGNYETRENIKLGDYFIELWRKTAEEQRQNMKKCWTTRGKTKLLPRKDILEELTKTLKRIMKPYKELRKTQGGE